MSKCVDKTCERYKDCPDFQKTSNDSGYCHRDNKKVFATEFDTELGDLKVKLGDFL